MRRRLLVRSATAIALAPMLAATATGCSSSTSPASSDSGLGLTAFATAHRTAAPDLAGVTLTDAGLSLQKLRGKVVVVNFWAPWCAPCRAESPGLMTVYRNTAARGVTFLGVVERPDSKASVLSFVRDHGVTYPSVLDNNGSLAASWPGVIGLPFTYVLDRHGRIAARVIGAITPDELQREVLRVAGEA